MKPPTPQTTQDDRARYVDWLRDLYLGGDLDEILFPPNADVGPLLRELETSTVPSDNREDG